jgi:hypothetical protein
MVAPVALMGHRGNGLLTSLLRWGPFWGSVVAVGLPSAQGKPGLPVWSSMGYPFGLGDPG